jgi:hypothetical protein
MSSSHTIAASLPARFATACLCMLMMFAVVACSGGAGEGKVGLPTGKALFTNAPPGVTLTQGSAAAYTIGGGTPTYSVNTSNRDVATAAVSGSGVTITAIAAGSATIGVTDAAGASVTIPVTVTASVVAPPAPAPSLYTTAPTALTVAVDFAGAYTAGGGKRPYAITTSNAAVARASINGDNFVITGVQAGTAQVRLTDADGAALTIGVTVGSGAASTALFTTAPENVGLLANTTTNYLVGGGTGSYSAASANPGIASATLSGTGLTVTAIAPGTTTVRITDAAGGSLSISVNVAQVVTPVIEVLPASATGNVGDVLQFFASGGVPGYSVTINNPSIASAAPATVSSSGGSFSVRLTNVGTTVATIVDARGQSSALPITVGATSTVLRLSPSALIVGENATEVLDLNIYGGTGPYRAITSDLRLSSVIVDGTILSIGLGQNGNRCIASQTESGNYVPFGTYDVIVTAIDSLGASATSTMTIKDNGLGLNLACP